MSNVIRSTAALLVSLGCLSAAWAGISRDDAAAIAQRMAPGRVLAVEQGIHTDNKPVWRVRIVTAAGELRLLVIDAETGRAR
jgi:uncharacterized membrane protein YkoI